MAYATSPEFQKHSANVAEIRRSLKQIERLHRAAIRSAGKVALDPSMDDAAVTAFRRMHHLLIGVLAEATLRKIITDPTGGFNERDRQRLWQLSQPERWLTVVDLAFQHHFQVPSGLALTEAALGRTAFERYSTVRRLLTGDLHPVITDRNKTAHGQWVYHLKSHEENVFKPGGAPPPPAYTVSYAQSRLIEAIAKLVYVLVVFEPTFQRDYDDTIRTIDKARVALDGSTYSGFVISLSRNKLMSPSQ